MDSYTFITSVAWLFSLGLSIIEDVFFYIPLKIYMFNICLWAFLPEKRRETLENPLTATQELGDSDADDAEDAEDADDADDEAEDAPRD